MNPSQNKQNKLFLLLRQFLFIRGNNSIQFSFIYVLV